MQAPPLPRDAPVGSVYPVTLVTWYQVAPSEGWIALTDIKIDGWAVYYCTAGRTEYCAFFPTREAACGHADLSARMARKQLTA